MEPERPTPLYVSYSQKDEALKQEFEDYLVNLQQARLISGWIERQVQPGADWSQVIDPRLETAQLFLLLLSPSLLASGYCSGAEFQEAFEQRRRRGEMRVIPIFLHHVDVTWHRGHFPTRNSHVWEFRVGKCPQKNVKTRRDT